MPLVCVSREEPICHCHNGSQYMVLLPPWLLNISGHAPARVTRSVQELNPIPAGVVTLSFFTNVHSNQTQTDRQTDYWVSRYPCRCCSSIKLSGFILPMFSQFPHASVQLFGFLTILPAFRLDYCSGQCSIKEYGKADTLLGDTSWDRSHLKGIPRNRWFII